MLLALPAAALEPDASPAPDVVPSPAPDVIPSPEPVRVTPPAPAVVAPPASAPPPVSLVESPAPGRAKRIAGVLTTLVGAALVVAGGAMGNQSAQDSDAVTGLFQEGGVWNSSAQNLDKEGRRDDVAQKVLFPLGAAAVITGVTVAILGWLQDRRHVVPAATKGGATTWSVSF